MNRKDILFIFLILTISIGLLAVSEGICLIYTGDNNSINYTMSMPILDWMPGLPGTSNYIMPIYTMPIQMSLNPTFDLVNLFNNTMFNTFNNNLFNNGIGYLGNFQTNNYPGSLLNYPNNLLGQANAFNYLTGSSNTFNYLSSGSNMFNNGWGFYDPLKPGTNSFNNQYFLPNSLNTNPANLSIIASSSPSISQPTRKKVDDWKYDPGTSTGTGYSSGSSSGSSYYTSGSVYYGGLGGGGLYGGYGGGYSSMAYSYSPSAASPTSASYSSSSYIGYSTGGAKDVNNFRENIKNDYLPISTDITFEGLFYDYFFDTGQQEECLEKFCPSYCAAQTMEPFSEDTEYFLSVGLNSGIKKEDFQRKRLNLVIVLDISGSMGSAFNQYYYDQFGNQQSIEDSDIGKRKITIATETIVDLLDHLRGDDRFGMVLFETVGYLAKPLRLVSETDMDAIKEHILDIGDRGSTNMEAGMNIATEMFDEFLDEDPTVYENRIIFLTDAMPNTGQTSDKSLLGMTRGNADNMVFSTFIGIGVDFNTELIELITKIRGANYYSVHSSAQFRGRMVEEFEYMVTPLLFGLRLELDATGCKIEKVYGSPEADEATGKIMTVNTLFPTKTDETGTKGGMVLLKLNKLSNDAQLTLTVSYEDREGNEYQNSKVIPFEEHEPEYFENRGIRKAVLLSRYANMIKNWITDERKSLKDNAPPGHTIFYDYGPPCIYLPCLVPPCSCFWPTCPRPFKFELGEWERQSVTLNVSEEYKQLFAEFKDYFEVEMAAIADDTMQQEVDILETLSTFGE
ncbi:MAG: vWA domain-containing protein [bacterium]